MDNKLYNSLLKPILIFKAHVVKLRYLRCATINYRLALLEPRFPSIHLKIRIGIMCFLLLLPFKIYAIENIKIAVVDVQYVLDHSDAVIHLREAIDKLSEKLHKEMSTKEENLKKIESELVKKREILKQEQFDTEVNNFYKQVSTTQHEMQQKKIKLEQAHAEAINIVHDNTLKIIAKLAKEKGFHLALPTSQILYTEETLSITLDVVDKLNNELKSIPLNYK